MAGCILGLLYPIFEIVGLSLGAISFSLMGPFYSLYLKSLWTPSIKIMIKDYYHFIPSIILLGLIPFANVFTIFGLYLFSFLCLSIYFGFGVRYLVRRRFSYRTDNSRWRWTIYFNSAIAMLLFLFLAQSFFFDAFIYQGIIVSSALICYALTLISQRQSKLFMYEPRKRGNQDDIQSLSKKIKKLVEKDELYTNPLLSIAVLSKLIQIPPYQISLTVNTHFNKSFPEFVNSYRIQKAEQLLKDPSSRHRTIESIAYESGFSALSAFYTAFKKTHKTSPNKFRLNQS